MMQEFFHEFMRRAPDNKLAERLVRATSDRASELLACDRMDVLQNAARLCVTQRLWRKIQEELLNAIVRAARARVARHTDTEEVGGEAEIGQRSDALGTLRNSVGLEGGEQVGERGGEGTTEARLDETVVLELLGMRLLTGGTLDDRRFNVRGIYVVHHLLHFEASLVGPVLRAISELPLPALDFIVRDKAGCHCLLGSLLGVARGEGVTEAIRQEGKNAREKIMSTFAGSLVDLACNNVAWHFLVQCFHDSKRGENA